MKSLWSFTFPSNIFYVVLHFMYLLMVILTNNGKWCHIPVMIVKADCKFPKSSFVMRTWISSIIFILAFILYRKTKILALMSGWIIIFSLRGISWFGRAGRNFGFGRYIWGYGDRVACSEVLGDGGIGHGASGSQYRSLKKVSEDTIHFGSLK